MKFFAADRMTQHAYWKDVDEEHYAWRVGKSYFAGTERALIAQAGLHGARRLLEIGCGEGANLSHLGVKSGWVGIDFSLAKLAFARARLQSLQVAASDAACLPFADASFDAVLIRDVLHHVPNRQLVLTEASRVLMPAGTLAVIEPNRASPLIVAQALLVRSERAVLRSTMRRLRIELESAGFSEVETSYAQALPLARIAQHPRLGLPPRAQHERIDRLLAVADRISARLIPSRHWMYLVGRGVR
jgi:ubiquinone/menaquinone biosynthesis C-methylase UbiE